MSGGIAPTPERQRRGVGYGQPSQVLGDDGKLSAPFRPWLRSLKRLHDSGKIGEAQYAAGLRFHLDWQDAQGSDVRAMDLSRDVIDGAGNGHGLPRSSVAARALDAAATALSDRLQRDAAEDIVGAGISIRGFERIRKMRSGTATAILIAALTNLNKHYQSVDAGTEKRHK